MKLEDKLGGRCGKSIFGMEREIEPYLRKTDNT
jgi:hypothetical protein